MGLSMTNRAVKSTRYIIVSPVKDEVSHIKETLDSVVAQTIRPFIWLIVDDGSTDGTKEIIRSYCARHDWIRLLINNRPGQRNTGSAEVIAFSLGYETVRNEDFDFVVKLDGDLRLEPDYFEKLFVEFEKNPALGIASGIYLERHGNGWQPVRMPGYHAAGATKVIRKACFEEIGGFIDTPGWDTVDEIRAWGKGWRTAHFENATFHHLKNEGSGMGYRKTNHMHGEIYYLTGGSKAFFLGKVSKRIALGQPFLLAGIYMFLGYLRPMINKKPLLVTPEESRLYRKMLRGRLVLGQRSGR